MTTQRAYAPVIERLKGAGLRPTRQRLALARLLFTDGGRHVTAEMLHEEVTRARLRVSLATVYNTLHQFTDVGLLREVMVAPGRSYFDTNTDDHHHFYDEQTGALTDIDAGDIALSHVPAPPPGQRIARVDVVVRLSSEDS